MIRAHRAADWQQFEAEKDVLPNLEWKPSTSPNPGEDHRLFWGTVLPIDDPFWNEHKPGDRWNCKCGLRNTDKKVGTVPTGGQKDMPARGLENNPGKDGHLFSDKHNYFPDSCVSCPFSGGKLSSLFADLAGKKNCYSCKKSTKVVEKTQQKVRKQELTEYDHEILKQFDGKKIECLSGGLQTGKMVLNKDIVESYLYHAVSKENKDLILTINRDIDHLKSNNDFEVLKTKGKSKSNIARKKRRGVIGYSTYTYTKNGVDYIIGMENRKKYEVPYFSAIKKIKSTNVVVQ